jgi:hypothetical protein
LHVHVCNNLVAINPSRQFAQANNAQRTNDAAAILNAIGQNIADNKGTFGGVCSVSLPSSYAVIGTGGTDLSCLVPIYMSALPLDPKTSGTAADTGYSVKLDSTTKRVSVKADDAELSATIELTR